MVDKQITEQGSEPGRKPRIYTMPEKFLIEDKGGGGKKNTFLVVAIIIVVVLLLGVGAYILIQKLGTKNTNNANQLSNVNEQLNANTTVNGNGNTNHVNVNYFGNANMAINSNANTNLSNLNLFPNINGNSNAVTNGNVNVASSQDTDLDGLTDVEEALYGTNLSVADTDKDGYTDGQELVSGYNPNGSSKLENSDKVRIYNNSVEGYTLLYPAAWAVSDDPSDTHGKIFTAGGEFVVVSVQENPARLSARDWYLTKSPGADSSKLVTVANWSKSLSGILSPDALTAYYTAADNVYVISYNTNILSQANYKTTFQMMYKSFSLQAVANSNVSININLNTNSNTNANRNANSNLNSNTNDTNRL